MKFQDSITEQTMTGVKEKWAKELSDTAQWLETETQEKIFDFLNERKNLCTAEFVLRRQIQTTFPKFLKAAADGKNFADLSKSGNVSWPIELVENLSGILSAEKYIGVSELNLDRRQWKKILLGEAFCNRATAVKLIFALKMDEATAAKFLIANGKNFFSTRNPFDYICEFCHKGKFTFDEAAEMLAEFESQRKDFLNDDWQDSSDFGTIQLENETEKILNDGKLCAEDKKIQLVKYMLAHQKEFVTKVERKERRAEYPSGFSKQNNLKLKTFLKYLTKLYPKFLKWKEVNDLDSYLISRKVRTNAYGAPKVPDQLIRAMTDAQEIYFWETEELEEIGLPTGNERDEKGKRQLKSKQSYDAIPFNSAILLPLKNLSKTLRANLRAEEHPDNAQEVDRSTILFLTYFFISGCKAASDEERDNLSAALDEEINGSDNAQKNNLLYALKNVAGNVESLSDEENPLELYVDSLNELLETFNCNEFYAPFVIDRFILFCLLTLRRPENEEDFPQYLMNLIIEESYRLSKKILEEKENDG